MLLECRIFYSIPSIEVPLSPLWFSLYNPYTHFTVWGCATPYTMGLSVSFLMLCFLVCGKWKCYNIMPRTLRKSRFVWSWFMIYTINFDAFYIILSIYASVFYARIKKSIKRPLRYRRYSIILLKYYILMCLLYLPNIIPVLTSSLRDFSIRIERSWDAC